MADLAELAFAGWLAEEERARQKNIVLVRDYYDGDQKVQLSERLKEFLGFSDSGRFCLNYCATVVNAVWERLIMAALSSDDDQFSQAAWDWWVHNRMDEKQDTVHRGAVRDGEFFVIVDLDADNKPRYIPHPRYTDPVAGGTGFGCKAVYPDGMTSLPMEYASKRWTETVTLENGQRETRQRMTVYYPGEVRKYRQAARTGESGWVKHQDDGDANWPIPWLDKRGRPLGIPVIHFCNPDSKSELWDAIPPQDGINKTAVDILAAADAAGFPIRVLIGKRSVTTDGKPPASDGSNYLKLSAGCWIEAGEGGDVKTLESANLAPLVATLDSWINKLAQVTDTPLSRFQVTGQIAAEGTLKQQESPLLSKVRVRQTKFGNSWEDLAYMARKLVNTFANAGLDEDATLSVEWKPAATRDEKAHLETLKIKAELGIPDETLWQEMGYNADEIATMAAQRGEERAASSNFGGELLREFERGG